jgi:hypothetical protein
MMSRFPALVLGIALVSACHTDAPPAAVIERPSLTPRTDGVYVTRKDNLVQYLHFYPGGNVLTMNCLASVADSLRGTMRSDHPPDLMKGTHNVPYTAQHDSVTFRTTVMQGFIDYKGLLHAGDSITMVKTSTVSGQSYYPVYRFEADPSGQQVP